MAEQHQQMQQQHQAQHITAQILNVQGGVATLDDSVPVQIMMPAGVVMEQHHQVQQEQQIQVPQHVQEMQEVIQEAVGSATTQVVQEDPKLTNKKELSKQWKSLCKRAKQWCSMHDDSVPNFVMMYLDENRLVWEGPDHMESFISDESVISAFLRTAALSESLIGMEKRGVDEMQDVAPRPAKKQKKAETPSTSKKGMTDDEVIASILEKPEAVPESAAGDEGAGADGDDSDGDNVPSQTTDTDQPSQSTSEGPTQSGEGDVLSQVIESVIKDWAPGQGPPPTSQEGEEETGDANVPDETNGYGIVKSEVDEVPDQTTSVSLIRGSAMSKVGGAAPHGFAASLRFDEDDNGAGGALKPEFLCPCGIVLTSRKLFQQHCEKTHIGSKAFQCKICEKNLSTGQKLKRHMLLHTDGNLKMAFPDGPTRFKCPDCSLYFNLSLGLQYHMKNKHGKTLDKSNLEHLEVYSASHKYVTCSKCLLEFKTRDELKNHMKSHARDKPFTCEQCGRKFSLRSSLKKHEKTHLGEDGLNDENLCSEKSASKQPCVCDQCGKTLSSRRSLKMHKIWVHQGIKPFPCPHCPREYCQRRDLEHHINILHGSAKLLKIQVGKDGRRVVLGRGKHACDVCKREFSSRRPLQVHMRIHTGEKPFTCDHCQRPFARKSDLVKHSRLHSGEKPYECPVCRKRFRAISNMKLHARKSCRYEKFGPLPPSSIPPIKLVSVPQSESNTSLAVYHQFTQQMDDKEIASIEVNYEDGANVITEGVIQQIEGSDGTGSYQVILPAGSDASGLTTIELRDIGQAVASHAEFNEQGQQLVYVTKSLLHELPTATTVPEPSTSEIHMAADTIAKIEAIHNAQLNR